MLKCYRLCNCALGAGCGHDRKSFFFHSTGKAPGNFTGISWGWEQICLASSALTGINRAPVFLRGHDDRTRSVPHPGDRCKTDVGGSLVPSARRFWKPPSPSVVTLRGSSHLQWVPAWVAMGSKWVGASQGDPRPPGRDWLVHQPCAWSLSRSPPRDAIESRRRCICIYICNNKKITALGSLDLTAFAEGPSASPCLSLGLKIAVSAAEL